MVGRRVRGRKRRGRREERRGERGRRARNGVAVGGSDGRVRLWEGQAARGGAAGTPPRLVLTSKRPEMEEEAGGVRERWGGCHSAAYQQVLRPPLLCASTTAAACVGKPRGRAHPNVRPRRPLDTGHPRRRLPARPGAWPQPRGSRPPSVRCTRAPHALGRPRPNGRQGARAGGAPRPGGGPAPPTDGATPACQSGHLASAPARGPARRGAAALSNGVRWWEKAGAARRRGEEIRGAPAPCAGGWRGGGGSGWCVARRGGVAAL